MMLRIFLLLFVCFGAHANPAADLTTLLNGIVNFRAAYVQTTTDPKFYDQKRVQGKAVIARPNQFRWEIEKPYQQLLVADGKNLWIFDADLDQVTVQPLKSNLKDTPALLLAGDPRAITDHFKVSLKDSDFGETTYELTPTDEDSLVRAVQMTFKGSALTRMVLVDNLHQIVTIEFSDMKMNDKLPQDIFRFVPPAGVDVIRND